MSRRRAASLFAAGILLISLLSPPLALSPPLSFGAAFAERPAFSGGGAAAAACAARRAAAIKLDELTGSFGAAAISLIDFSSANRIATTRR